MKRGPWQLALAELDQGRRAGMTIVVDSSSHSPGTSGACLCVCADGRQVGTIGGGIMEARAVSALRAVLASSSVPGGPEVVRLHHDREATGARSGMICAGWQDNLTWFPATDADAASIARILAMLEQDKPFHLGVGARGVRVAGQEPTEPSSEVGDGVWYPFGPVGRVAILGAGHCGSALAAQMRRLDWSVRLFDTRAVVPADARPDDVPVETLDDYGAAARVIDAPESTAVVVMTADFPSDIRALSGVLFRARTTRFPYVGVMGSAAKIVRIFGALRDEGFGDDELARVHAPVGIPIKSDTPEEIAVSVAAELLGLARSFTR